jgi:predicted transcriptional regulator
MEYTPPPRKAIESYLSQKGSAHIRHLAIHGNTSEEVAESIVRALRDEGKVRYLHDEQEDGAKVAIWTDS